MLSRWALACASSASLRSASARASASCSVMLLNERVSMPSSSRLGSAARWLKSPCATARVPSTSTLSGADSRSESRNDAAQRGEQREQQRERERDAVEALQPAAREQQLLVFPVARLHGLGVARELFGHRLHELQRARFLAQSEATLHRHEHAQVQAAGPGSIRSRRSVCCSRSLPQRRRRPAARAAMPARSLPGVGDQLAALACTASPPARRPARAARSARRACSGGRPHRQRERHRVGLAR